VRRRELMTFVGGAAASWWRTVQTQAVNAGIGSVRCCACCGRSALQEHQAEESEAHAPLRIRCQVLRASANISRASKSEE
jgi:hypothetical protein